MTQIILDCCSNHLGDMRIIKEMIKKAAEIKADYVKFQVFNAERLNRNFPDYETNLEYYKQVQISYYDIAEIIKLSKELNIKPLFTAFDLPSAMLLEPMVKEVKIASPDATNYELIDYCLKRFNKVFISTGMSTPQEIIQLRDYVKDYINVVLFYCVSKYPTKRSDINKHVMIQFDGFSDHTEGIEASKEAIDFDMKYIEKHFTLGKYLPGKDQSMSISVDEARELVQYRDYVAKIPVYKSRWNP
jgi:N,N'-diacetyllegionaminate synthase